MTAAGGDHGCWASVQGSDPTSWRDLPFNDESQELEFPRCVCYVGMERHGEGVDMERGDGSWCRWRRGAHLFLFSGMPFLVAERFSHEKKRLITHFAIVKEVASPWTATTPLTQLMRVIHAGTIPPGGEGGGCRRRAHPHTTATTSATWRTKSKKRVQPSIVFFYYAAVWFRGLQPKQLPRDFPLCL